MKGIVFCEFITFVEQSAGYETVDQMILDAAPPSGGVYTAVGRYDFSEMAALVSALSKNVDRPAQCLLREFGRYLFGRLAALHPDFVEDASDPLTLLATVESKIHVEVKKLYPDAELPTLRATRLGADAVALEYRSCRPLGELCIGLIEGCAVHFKTPLSLQAEARPGGIDLIVRRSASASAEAPAPLAAAVEV